MSFIRHIGKIGDRKVAIIFREIPNEQHMCLVTYTETLNMHVHDPMMQTIESDIGQNSSNLADALNRTYTKDGKIILQVLHSEGLLKKVQTSQVIVTPSSNTRIKLDELNKILDEMQQGEAAVKRLAEIDTNRTAQEVTDIAKMMRGDKKVPPVAVPSQVDGILGDNVIVNNLRSQAAKMEAEAKGLLAESQRLQKEASDIEGPIAQSKPDKKKNLVETPTAIIETAKKRGRPAKSTLTA
jgi:hypothetical protein